MTNNIKIIKNNINQKSSKRVVFFNNKFVNEKDANISIYDSALMFGDMVFEMTRSFNKIQFKLDQHLDRLYQGIKIYRIPITLSKKELKKICLQTVERNEHLFDNNDEHRLMINISRGPLGIYSEVFDNKIEPTIIVSDFTYEAKGEDISKIDTLNTQELEKKYNQVKRFIEACSDSTDGEDSDPQSEHEIACKRCRNHVWTKL